MDTWTRNGETATVRFECGLWWAWNTTRGHLAVLPADSVRSGFETREELEAALRADGWVYDSRGGANP